MTTVVNGNQVHKEQCVSFHDDEIKCFFLIYVSSWFIANGGN